VLSWIALRGRCAGCKQPISIRYPAIELLTGLLCVTALYRYGFSLSLFIRDIPFIVILIAVTFIDLEHRIIPNILSLGGIALGLATAFLDHRLGDPGHALAISAIGAALGFGLFYAFAWLYYRATNRSGLGGGDIKLLAMLGAFLGPAGVFYAILISSIFGSCVGIGWAVATRKKNLMTVAIPYGPFLVVGGLYYYLMGEIEWLRFTIPT
jgi:leader peptidase (prepilin peptidase)/N-methyltransferase